ncbi:LLM class flavin-dependent oxidoreductase [Myxococcota bacterium]|nr:LLM class flavin-dependent oxidoreductase [Myxococcota bacterium]
MHHQGRTFTVTLELPTLILDMFCELQCARPWADNHEQKLLAETLEQARLADGLGYGCWWMVEHHGATEFSYSSAPEMMLAAISQHTHQIHLGHSGVLAPFHINHPVRVAERGAYVDLLSGGRLELGLARSGGTEWDTFGVDPEASRDQLREALHMVPRMWTENDFEWHSDLIDIPERDVVPKPLQKPHPPLWQTSTSPESFTMAGELGVGVLCTTLLTPLESLRELLLHYDEGLSRCQQPVGQFVNAQRSAFTFVHCAESRTAAIESGAAEAALWFVNAAPKVFQVPRRFWIDVIRGDFLDGTPDAARVLESAEIHDDLDLDDPVPVIAMLNRQVAGQTLDPEEAYEVLEPIESVIIGDVDLCRKKMQGFADIGADRLMCMMQLGAVPHQQVMESIQRVGEVLLPEFATSP